MDYKKMIEATPPEGRTDREKFILDIIETRTSDNSLHVVPFETMHVEGKRGVHIFTNAGWGIETRNWTKDSKSPLLILFRDDKPPITFLAEEKQTEEQLTTILAWFVETAYFRFSNKDIPFRRGNMDFASLAKK